MMNSKYILLFLIFTFLAVGCTDDFDPPSKIEKQRFLAIAAEPLQAAPGQDVTFSALVINADGNLYEGPIAWAVAGGDEIRSEGEQGQQSLEYLEQPGGEPFVWTVPELDELEEMFGSMGKDGMLITVIAAAFIGGDINGKTIIATKLFAVSEAGAEKKFFNPQIDEIKMTAGGEAVEENEDGEFKTGAGKVKIKAVPDYGWDRLTYHWFANDGDFEPDFGSKQTVKTKSRELTNVYCVLRKEFYFSHDDDTQSRLIGLDWRYIPIRKP